MSKNLLVTIDTSTKPVSDVRTQYEQYYQTAKHRLVNADGTEVLISDRVFKVIQEILPVLEQGRTTVTISPASSEMTTQQAADILNVSRPHLIKLLEKNEIPYTKTGSHRRVKLKDIIDYKEKKELLCRQSLNEMAELMQENGLFD